jgi:hypothetical protein
LPQDYPENEEFKGLIVATANTYQGHENTYVFFDSTAAANLDGKVGFIDDSNSLAVATTRHKCGLAVFGDSRTYSTTVVTETNEGGDDTDGEDEDEEDGVDEAETKNSESTSKLQQLFAWFAESGRVVSESAGNPPEYICKQVTKETHEEARRKQKAREQQGDEHLFGDFTATDPDDENSNQQRNNQQPLRAPMARANEISQHQHTPEESSSSTRPDAKSDFLQDLQANQKVMDALAKIVRQEDFRPNDFNPLLPYHIFLRDSGVPNFAFRDFAFEVWEQMEWESDIHLCIDNALNNHLTCEGPSDMELKGKMNVPFGTPSNVTLWQVKASQQEALSHFDPDDEVVGSYPAQLCQILANGNPHRKEMGQGKEDPVRKDVERHVT